MGMHRLPPRTSSHSGERPSRNSNVRIRPMQGRRANLSGSWPTSVGTHTCGHRCARSSRRARRADRDHPDLLSFRGHATLLGAVPHWAMHRFTRQRIADVRSAKRAHGLQRRPSPSSLPVSGRRRSGRQTEWPGIRPSLPSSPGCAATRACRRASAAGACRASGNPG
jgi:hypothetical protein